MFEEGGDEDNNDDDDAAEGKSATSMASTAELKASNKTVDRARYRQFWSAQAFFSQPINCFDEQKWKQFTQCSDSIFDLFSREKLQVDARSNSSATRDPADALAAAAAVTTAGSAMPTREEHQYFVKYLTSPKLFVLQLADSSFRRQVLLQYLILFQFLTIPSKARKDHKLSASQGEYITNSRARVYSLLLETPPDAAQFVAGVKELLLKEERWVNWKIGGCRPFDQSLQTDGATAPGLEADAAPRNKRPKRDEGKGKTWQLGSADTLAECASAKRKFTPALAEYFADAIEQVIPENDIEQSYWDICKPDYNWVALRLLTRANIRIFQEMNDQHKTMKDFLAHALLSMRPSTEATAAAAAAPATEMEAAPASGGEGLPAEAATEGMAVDSAAPAASTEA